MIYVKHAKVYIAFGLKIIMCLYLSLCLAQALVHTAHMLVCPLGPFWNKPTSYLSIFFPSNGKADIVSEQALHKRATLHCLTAVKCSIFYEFL